MTTTDKNRIIAQFMGLRPKLESPDLYSFSDSPWFVTRGNDPEKIMDDIANYAKYHSDWNWIMGATIMCFKRYDEVTDSSVFSADNQQFKLNDALLETNIKSLHEAVYQFIVWHNAQVKENPKP